MNRKAKKTAKRGGAGKKQTKADQKPKYEPIAAEEREKMMAMLASGRALLHRIDQEVSNIPDPQERAQTRARRLAEIDAQLNRWQSEIEQHEDWEGIYNRYKYAKLITPDDPILTRLEADLQRLKLIHREMDKQGVSPDSPDRLQVAWEYESKNWMIYGRPGKSPDAQKDLSVALILAIKQVTDGRLMRIAQEKGRLLTAQERNEIDQRLWKSIRASFPAIAHQFAPNEFKDYAATILDPPRVYQDAIRLYLKKWTRLHGPRAALRTNINSSLVKEVMKDLGVPASKSHTFRQGIRDELKRRAIKRQERRKATRKKSE
jgi:hypothetical protein